MSAARARRPAARVTSIAVGASGVALAALALAAAARPALPGVPAAGLPGLGGPPSAACIGPVDSTNLPRRPGPTLRFGISPGVTAGQVGPPEPAKAQDSSRTLTVLGQLRAGRAAFVLRLTRLFWSDGETGIAQTLALAHQYTRAGYDVELQLRYRPPNGAGTDLSGWLAFVREVVDRFGGDRRVVGLQVTNEVNFSTSPDSSDGAYPGARDALIQGVQAAKGEAVRQRHAQLRVGFNWFYRADPASDQSFWAYLAQHGGAAFAAAVDWVGLDAYPGTFFPPSEPPGGFANGIVNALSVLRDCYMPVAALGASVPIFVEENGYPTGPGRGPQTQAAALLEMVRAVNDFRATFNVSDYRWFNLRDADSASSNPQQQFGLLRDDYAPKPAFDAYRRLVGALGGPPGARSSPARGVGLRLRVVVRDTRGAVRSGACVRAPVTLTWRGPDARRLRRLAVTVDGHPLRIRAGAHAVRIERPLLGGRRVHRVRFAASAGRGVLRGSLPLRVCRGTARDVETAPRAAAAG